MKKQWILTALLALGGVALGAAIALVLSGAKKDKNTKFEAGDLWEKIVYQAENDGSAFLDNYLSVYTKMYYNDTDEVLAPYFEKYGYDAVLVSGLESDEIYIQTYCIEKCCALYGDEKIKDKGEILKALEKISIDTTQKTDDGLEIDYIKTATDRLALAKALYLQNYSDSEDIAINESGNIICWLAGMFEAEPVYRACENGRFYDISDLDRRGLSLKFEEDDAVLIYEEFNPSIAGVMVFKQKPQVIFISEALSEYVRKDYEGDAVLYAQITEAYYKDRKISGTCYISGIADSTPHRFGIDIDTGEIVFE